MESTKDRLPLPSESSRRGGIAGDFRRLKSDGAASADELREFMGQLRGKSPQEVLGIVAESGLTKGILISTLGFVVLLVAFTIGPYAVKKISADGSSTADKKAKSKAASSAKAEKSDAKTNDAQTSSVAANKADNSSKPDPEKITGALGIDETKIADPKTNPLDKKLDGLLDKID